MNILVVGGFDGADAEASDMRTYAKALGAEILRQGHILYNGCQTEWDAIVAEAAFGKAQQRPDSLVSYVLSGAKPVHSFGKIINSRLTTWGSRRHVYVSEQIHARIRTIAEAQGRASAQTA